MENAKSGRCWDGASDGARMGLRSALGRGLRLYREARVAESTRGRKKNEKEKGRKKRSQRESEKERKRKKIFNRRGERNLIK